LAEKQHSYEQGEHPLVYPPVGTRGQAPLLIPQDSAPANRSRLWSTLGPTGTKEWVVDCKSVGSGRSALIYLGRYLYRGVIREEDILACDHGEVTFRYRDAKSGQHEVRTVSGPRFVWLVLQHVLPKGFRRARNFGFLHPNAKGLIALLQLLLKFDPAVALGWLKPRKTMCCRACGAPMKIVRTRIKPGVESRPPSKPWSEGSACML